MQRREFIVGFGAAMAWPLMARAQQRVRMRRIGVLLEAISGDPEFLRRIAVFTQSLRELGWIEGQNLAIETRYSEGKSERLPALVTELIESKIDVFVIQGIRPLQAARKATDTIPIVMPGTGDAVGQGLVASLARPGGNITGLTMISTQQSTKRLQLIKEIYPSLVRLAVRLERGSPSSSLATKGVGACCVGVGDCVTTHRDAPDRGDRSWIADRNPSERPSHHDAG